VNALKKAGAKSVRIACFARVLDEALPDSRQPNALDQTSLAPQSETPEVPLEPRAPRDEIKRTHFEKLE